MLVTGGGTGIGAAVARQLAKAGDRVVICGRRPEPLQRVAEPTGALAVVADVSEASGVTTVVQEAIAAFGRLDGLVLNHGIIRTGQVDELSPQDWDDTLRVNLTGPFLLIKAALPHLLRARGAVVSGGLRRRASGQRGDGGILRQQGRAGSADPVAGG